MASPVPTGPSATRLCPLCPQEPWWVTAYCPPWESPGVLGWWDTAATCPLVPFCPAARAQLVLLPHNTPSLVPGSCRSTGELSLPGDHPAWLFLPLLLKALPHPSVTQGSHCLRIRPSCPPWRLWSVHHHAEASQFCWGLGWLLHHIPAQNSARLSGKFPLLRWRLRKYRGEQRPPGKPPPRQLDHRQAGHLLLLSRGTVCW